MQIPLRLGLGVKFRHDAGNKIHKRDEDAKIKHSNPPTQNEQKIPDGRRKKLIENPAVRPYA